MSGPAESPRQLYYIADWLPPEFGAVGQYAMLFARAFAESGRDVCLVGLTSGRPRVEREAAGDGGSLEIRRIAATRYDRSSNLRRLLWAFRSNLRLVREVIRHPRSRGAEILFTGAPPFMLFFVVFLKPLLGARLVYRITDFYPEVIVAELGGASLPIALLQRVTWFLRRRIDFFEVLGEDQRRLLTENGIRPERIVLKRDIAPVAISGRETPVERPPEARGRVALLYSGNYGVAHDLDTVIEGLIRYHRRGGNRVVLWLNASGRNADLAVERLRAASIPCVRTAPVPLDALPGLLAAADVHLITLRPRFSGFVVPSKVYACIASRRPILFVGPENSDVHLLCRQAEGLPYERVEPGDVAGFGQALERLTEARFAASA